MSGEETARAQHERRILFVEAEERLAAALRSDADPSWHIATAADNDEALDLLAAGDFDVVLTEVGCASIDAPEILDELRRHLPAAIRVALTPETEPAAWMESSSSFQLAISRESSVNALTAAIGRALSAHDLLEDETLRELVGSMESVPSLPETYERLERLLRDPDASIQDAGAIIEQDVAMTAKVLQLVNSALFGLQEECKGPVHAVKLLGLDNLRPLALSVGVFQQFDPKVTERCNLKSLQAHAVKTGMLAKRIAEDFVMTDRRVHQAFTAGLMHDIGRMLLAQASPARYRRCQAREDEGGDLLAAEREIFGRTHAEVGAYLLALWGLPAAIVEAVAFHHEPSKAGHTRMTPLTAVHVANGLLQPRVKPDGTSGPDHDAEYLTTIGIAERFGASQPA